MFFFASPLLYELFSLFFPPPRFFFLYKQSFSRKAARRGMKTFSIFLWELMDSSHLSKPSFCPVFNTSQNHSPPLNWSRFPICRIFCSSRCLPFPFPPPYCLAIESLFNRGSLVSRVLLSRCRLGSPYWFGFNHHEIFPQSLPLTARYHWQRSPE